MHYKRALIGCIFAFLTEKRAREGALSAFAGPSCASLIAHKNEGSPKWVKSLSAKTCENGGR